MEHQNEEVIAHEEEILEEGQMEGEYYEEYIDVDETGELIDTKDQIYVDRNGDEQIIDEQYIEEDGQPYMEEVEQETYDEEGQMVRVVRAPVNRHRLQQYNTVYMPPQQQQHDRGSYGHRIQQMQRPGYSGQNRQYHVQQLGHGASVRAPIRPQHSGYQMSKRNSYPDPRLNQEYRVQRNSPMYSDQKIKGYYEQELDMKPTQVVRPVNALTNISNASINSPVISSTSFNNRSGIIQSRDSFPGPVVANYMTGGPKPIQKPRNKPPAKKKPCNCTKSTCLKLYCDCFANGEFCLDCNCKDCHNNLEHEQERSRAIKSSLDRNPSAFKPKIGVAAKVGRNIDMERLHQKGCHCKKSNCLKNYCECYEAKVPCTDRCKCCSCRNTEADRHKYKDKLGSGMGGLAQLAAVAAADARSSSPFSDDESESGAATTEVPMLKNQPWFYMQEDVIEATTNCLVAQAKESEDQEGMTEEIEERDVLVEFGRCLKQFIDNATYDGSHR